MKATLHAAGGCGPAMSKSWDFSHSPAATGWKGAGRMRQVALLLSRALPTYRPPAVASVHLDARLSHPADSTRSYRVWRMRRCPNSVITYKWILVLKMLKKIALLIFFRIYRRNIHKKVPLKNTLCFWKYKKDKFDKKIYYCTIILLLFALRNLSFYISKNTTYFLTGLFYIHSSCIYLSIYLNP
jgi:hypothetical protein